jgi:Flp pilus assembly protein TadG
MVELAVVLPLIAALIVCLVDFGFGIGDQLDATQLASQAARQAAVDSTALSGGVQAYVRSQADSRNMQGATATICFPNGTATIGDPVRVTVTSSFSLTRIIPSLSWPVQGQATMRLEQLPTTYTGGAC